MWAYVAGARMRLVVNRNVWVSLHRWAGLCMAVFLVVAGLTGTILAFYEELERWLNPHLHKVRPHGAAMAPLALRALAEQHTPQGRIDFVDLQHQPDTSVVFYLQPRLDPATGQPYELAFDQLFIDPYTGQVLGTRKWGEFGLDRERLLPFLYRLHFTLALPEPWGRWLLASRHCCGAWIVSSASISPCPVRGRIFCGVGNAPGASKGAVPGTGSTSICTAQPASGPGQCC
jgi:uncharacterized iron-regulated membrane protein